MFFGDGTARVTTIFSAPLGWFLSPRRLALEWIRTPERWKRHLTAESGRLAGELGQEKFSLWNKVHYAPRLQSVDDERVHTFSVRVIAREYRGLPPARVIVIADQFGLHATHAPGRRGDGVTLVTQN